MVDDRGQALCCPALPADLFRSAAVPQHRRETAHGRRWIGRYGAGGAEPRPCGRHTIRNGTAYADTLKLCIEWARTHGASERVYSYVKA